MQLDMAPILKILLLSAGLTKAKALAPKIILVAKFFDQLLQTPKKLGML